MKRSTFTRVSALALIAAMSFSSCSKKEPAEIKVRHKDLDETVAASETEPMASAATTEALPDETDATTTAAPVSQNIKDIITVYTYTDDLTDLCYRFEDTHPDFPYTFNITKIDTYSGYSDILEGVIRDGSEAPDIFAVDESFGYDYFQGELMDYTAPYEDFGIDVDDGIDYAVIAPYIVETGTRASDNQVVGLSYQSDGCVMVYRTDIAEEVFGTSDPLDIDVLIGGDSGSWDSFKAAAEKLDEAGYCAVSGYYDMWVLQKSQSTSSWVVDGKPNISPENESFLDTAYEFQDYMNQTTWWSEAWNADMAGKSDREVFAYFGPAWFINYTLEVNAGSTMGKWNVTEAPLSAYWGGLWVVPSIYASNADSEKKAAIGEFLYWLTLDTSEDGAQYYMASGEFRDGKLTQVASEVVQASVDITIPVLGDQADINYYFANASQYAPCNPKSGDDDAINSMFLEYVQYYLNGENTREETIEYIKNDMPYYISN